MISFFVESLTGERRYTLFPTGTIVSDFCITTAQNVSCRCVERSCTVAITHGTTKKDEIKNFKQQKQKNKNYHQRAETFGEFYDLSTPNKIGKFLETSIGYIRKF